MKNQGGEYFVQEITPGFDSNILSHREVRDGASGSKAGLAPDPWDSVGLLTGGLPAGNALPGGGQLRQSIWIYVPVPLYAGSISVAGGELSVRADQWDGPAPLDLLQKSWPLTAGSDEAIPSTLVQHQGLSRKSTL
jgi:hypothetical protein